MSPSSARGRRARRLGRGASSSPLSSACASVSEPIAGKVLTKDPTNVRMLRVMVSANCIAGDSAIAQDYYVKLPAFDRGQMKTRCDRYGVTLNDPVQ